MYMYLESPFAYFSNLLAHFSCVIIVILSSFIFNAKISLWLFASHYYMCYTHHSHNHWYYNFSSRQSKQRKKIQEKKMHQPLECVSCFQLFVRFQFRHYIEIDGLRKTSDHIIKKSNNNNGNEHWEHQCIMWNVHDKVCKLIVYTYIEADVIFRIMCIFFYFTQWIFSSFFVCVCVCVCLMAIIIPPRYFVHLFSAQSQ